MRNKFEFRGYRARVAFDPDTGRFVYQREADLVVGEPQPIADPPDVIAQATKAPPQALPPPAKWVRRGQRIRTKVTSARMKKQAPNSGLERLEGTQFHPPKSPPQA